MRRELQCIVALFLVVALLALGAGHAPRADAQNPPGTSQEDTWTGKDEFLAAGSVTLPGAGTAVIVTSSAGAFGKTAGKVILNIRAITTISSSSAGVLVIRDGASGSDIATLYFAANTPQQIREELLGVGPQSSAGNSIYAAMAGGTTLTYTMRVRRQ